MLDELVRGGFPFERKVRKKLLDCGLKTESSQYFKKFPDGEISSELDVFGTIKSAFIQAPGSPNHASLKLNLVGAVKKYSEMKICFYELDNENPDNFDILFPNLLNHALSLNKFLGGYQTLSEFYNNWGSLHFSKSVIVLEPKSRESGFVSKGNAPLFSIANDLARACEYLHQKSILGPSQNSVLFHGCFPVLFTDSEIFLISESDAIDLKPVDSFMYLVTCRDLDEVPLATKEHYYLPILVSNFAGIEKVAGLLQQISDCLSDEINSLARNPAALQNEIRHYNQQFAMPGQKPPASIRKI